MSVTRRKTLHYKRARYLMGGNQSLQTLVEAAIAKHKDPDAREQSIVEGGTTMRVVIGAKKSAGMQVGQLIQYTKGQKQAYFEKDAQSGDYVVKVTSLNVGGAAARKQARELVESMLYFAVKENHILFIGTQALRSKHLEQHLNWLLQHGGVLDKDDYVLLTDQPSPEAQSSLAGGHAHTIKLGGDLDFEVVDKTSETVPTPSGKKTKVKTTKFVKPMGEMADVLTGLLGPWFGDAALPVPDGKNEKVELALSVKYTSRKKSETGFELMDRLAVAARHFDKEDCAIDLYQGGTLKGDDLKLDGLIDVSVSEESGLVDDMDLWTPISKWLETRIKNKMIMV